MIFVPHICAHSLSASPMLETGRKRKERKVTSPQPVSYFMCLEYLVVLGI